MFALTRTATRGLSVSPQSNIKVAVLGATGGIGQPLSMFMKVSHQPSQVDQLAVYDVNNTKGLAADLSHIDTPCKVTAHTGEGELGYALKGCDVVLIPAGVPRKPGMTRDDLFNTNANIVKTLVEGCVRYCPTASIGIISNPINSTVAIAAEVLKRNNAYDPRKLFGITTLDVVRARTFVAEKKNLDPTQVDIPVIGGHAGTTILPLLSQTEASTDVTFSNEEVDSLTVRIQNGGTEVVEAKAGAGSATLSMAWAGAQFAFSVIRAKNGEEGIVECTYIDADYFNQDCGFFAGRVSLGVDGVKEALPIGKLSAYEQEKLDNEVLPELRGSNSKGLRWAQDQY